jgi:hypothetical protein
MRSDILTAVSTENIIFSNVATCSVAEICRRFGVTYCVHLQEGKSKPSKLAWSVSLLSVTSQKTNNLWLLRIILKPYDVACLYKCFTGDSFPRRKSGRSVKATAHLCLVQSLRMRGVIHGVHHAGLSDFSVRGAARRHFSQQVAQLFRRKFRR